MVLDSKKIPYTVVDISADESGKGKMREIAGDPKALPPQIANGDQYCGVSFLLFAFSLNFPQASYQLPGYHKLPLGYGKISVFIPPDKVSTHPSLFLERA